VAVYKNMMKIKIKTKPHLGAMLSLTKHQ